MTAKSVPPEGDDQKGGAMADFFRLQVELDRQLADEIGNLQFLGGLRTKKDVIENALTAFRWAAREKAAGCAIVAIDPKDGSYSELQMPVLEVIAAKGTTKRKSLSARVRVFARSGRSASGRRTGMKNGWSRGTSSGY